MNQDNVKHLEIIQNVITRMNTNSFQIKSWSVTILSALLAVYASTKNELFILVSLVPTIIFWLLDTYYLKQERKFRGLYNDVSGVSDSLKSIKLFEMRPDLYVGGKYSFFNAFRSGTIFFLYFPLACLTIGSYVYLSGCN